MNKIRTSTFFLTFLFFGIAGTHFAQGQNVPSSPQPEETTPSEELVPCFDYYRFGSVPVDLSAETIRVAQGAQLQIKGRVNNQNSYRVDGITVYGKVYYKKNFDKSSFGPDIIQMLPLAEGISLEPGEEKTFTFTYPIPNTLKPGNYQVAAFVVSHNRFNMAGLSFTSDVVGNLLNFSIVGEDKGSVYFDNTKTVLNGIEFHSAIFPPRSSISEEGLPLSAVIANTTNLPVEGKIHWKVYSWDNMNSQNLIEETTTDVQVAAGAQSNVSYSVKDKSHTVYYVIGELMLKGSSAPVSTLQVRYIHSGQEAPSLPRIGFLGATQYPAEKDITKAFVCIHSTGSQDVKDAKVVLTVKSLQESKGVFGELLSRKKDSTVLSKEYVGAIPGRMSALALPFTENLNGFSVTADLYNNSGLLDSVTIEYPCVSSDTQSCVSQSSESSVIQSKRNISIIVGALGFALLVGVILLVRRKKRTLF